jgi:AraC-like DNA-binding protein
VEDDGGAAVHGANGTPAARGDLARGCDRSIPVCAARAGCDTRSVPRFAIAPVADTRDLRVIRALCDGCDGPRVAEEHVGTSRIWMLTSGCFELRDRAGRHAVDPAALFAFEAGHAFTIRHPCGADTCVAFSGPLADAIAARGAGARTPSPDAHARLLHEVAAWRRGEGDELALAEALCDAAAPEPRDPAAPSRRDRAIADELAFHLRVRFAGPASLSSLAAAAGVSPFHACRVFRRATGAGIHAYRRELRLRHALAMLIDGRSPIADVAAETGFASQSHLTNRFRERFGVTPARARRDAVGAR